MLPVVFEMATPEEDLVDVVTAVPLAGADGAGVAFHILMGVVNHSGGVGGINNHDACGVGRAVVGADGGQRGILRGEKGVVNYGDVGVGLDFAAAGVAEGSDQSESCHKSEQDDFLFLHRFDYFYVSIFCFVILNILNHVALQP